MEMNLKLHRSFVLASVLALPSCFGVGFDAALQDQRLQMPIDFSAGCSGGGSRVDERASMSWTLTQTRVGCDVRANVHNGQLIDFEKLRDRIYSQSANVKGVDLTLVRLTISGIRIIDVAGFDATPERALFSGSIRFANEDLFNFNSKTAADIARDAIVIELDDSGHPLVVKLNSALNGGSTDALKVSGTLDVNTLDPDFAVLQLEERNDHTIELAVDVEIEAVARVGL
jgi:hypothetical protein